MSKTTVIVVDDHPILRDSIVQLLEEEGGFEIVGEAGDGLEAVQQVDEKHPDVVVMDIEMPGMDGINATRQIKANHPEVSVLALTVHDGEEYITALLEAGATGYLLKTTYGRELIEAIRVASLGEFVLDTQIGSKVFQSFINYSSKRALPEIDKLTEREIELMRLVAHGKTNEEIARPLGISLSAVRNQLSGIFTKLKVSSRTGAIISCLRGGLISLDELTKKNIENRQAEGASLSQDHRVVEQVELGSSAY
jgi:NarL family two-component system response regulator LiaR